MFTQKELSLGRHRWPELVRNYEREGSVPPEEGDMGAEIRGEREVPRDALVTGLKFRDETFYKGGRM